MHRPSFATSLLLVTACLAPIDLSTQRCPCAPGFVCDQARDRCAAEECTAATRIDDFRATWATSNVIRWDWTPSGDRTRFLRYELQLAENPDDLGTSKGQRFTADQNPELAGFVLPRTRGTEDFVSTTMTHGLPAQRNFYGRLLAFDTDLCVFRSPVVAKATTLDLPDEIVIFRDTEPPGTSHNPTTYVPRPDAVGGGQHLEWVPNEDAVCQATPGNVCGDNLRIFGFLVDLRRIAAGTFVNSMLELKVANDGESASYYSRIWLRIEPCGDNQTIEPFTIPSSATYRTMQIPLSALGLTHARTSVDGGRLCEFNVGGQFSRTSSDGGWSHIRVDDARIRF